MMPPGASPVAMLEAVGQLLHNPPSPRASPSAIEQWHHDIDQLIVAAINTSPRGGAAGEPPRWGASDVSGTLVLTDSAT
jgi:hypothetical protein